MIEKRPDDWAVLEKLYDPEGLYKAKYKEEAERRGIHLPYRIRMVGGKNGTVQDVPSSNTSVSSLS